MADTGNPQDFSWPLWPLLPLYPYKHRRTLRREIVPDWVWSLEQVQGILYVVVPIRTIVVRLAEGGLLVYAPVAPTKECLRLLQELVDRYGEVRAIVLPTVSGLEHKVFVGPFARRFDRAQVFVAPKQWSFPVNLPLSWLGFPLKRTQVLQKGENPFGDEFDCAILGPLNLRLGWFGEVALFHRPSRTLLLTDTIVSIPEDPPEIVQLDPFPLLFHAREDSYERRTNTIENRRRGWQRICLFALYFQPSCLKLVDRGVGWREAVKAPDRSSRSYFGWFPFRWQENWPRSFEKLRKQGQVQVAPILQTLILNRDPQEVRAWVDRVSSWPFDRIVPCHFDAPVEATPEQFRQAFNFLDNPASDSNFPADDLSLLQQIDKRLLQFRIVPPPQR